MPPSPLDRIDRKILSELQSDGRLSNSDLADRVGLSESPCHRRVRRLEEQGYISGYQAHLDPHKLGHGLSVFVGVKVRRHTDEEVLPFESWARDRPEVESCFLITGEFDYLLHIAVRDLAAYETFLSHHLLKNGAINDIRSMFVLRNVKGPYGVFVDMAAASGETAG
jgi:Lrp/AsnC family leucine-responsive transcriptional regulator